MLYKLWTNNVVILFIVAGIPDVDVPSLTHLTGVGYTITLTCSIQNAFPAISKVYWERYIYGSITRLSSDSIGIMGVTVDNPSLIIPMAMESMTGEYTCLAVNSVGTGRSFPAKLTGGTILFFRFSCLEIVNMLCLVLSLSQLAEDTHT